MALTERLDSVLPGVTFDLTPLAIDTGAHVYALLTAGTHEEATRHQLAQIDLSLPKHRQIHALSCMFAVLWPVAIAAASFLERQDLAGVRFLEVGCGPGLPSLVAARLGAHVLATDHHPDAPALVAKNALLNHVRLQTEVLDWSLPLTQTFDRILASDVLFAADCCEPLAALIHSGLRPGGVAWVIDPSRPWHSTFEQACRARGLHVETTLEEIGEVVALVTTVQHARS